MRPPPDALGRVESYRATAEAATGRARAYRQEAARDRRAYLIQCEECRATATGRRHRGRLVSLGFPVDRRGRHVECGGRVAAYDIAEAG